MRIEAWRVHDSGLVAVPGRFRRLPGSVRHHRGWGEPWPDRVVLRLDDGELVVTDAAGGAVDEWAVEAVRVLRRPGGPPTTFVVELPDGAHLLAAPASAETDAFLAALSG